MRLLSVLILPLLLSACSGNDTISDIFAEWTAKDFYEDARLSLRSGEFQSAIESLESLEARFPFSPYAKQAQLDVAYAYFKFEEPDSAIAAADRFIRLNPRDAHVDYAWYLKGLANFSRGSGMMDTWFPRDLSKHDTQTLNDAIRDFSTLVRRFPDSQYSGDAYKRLIYLRNKLAEHEIHVADYYIKRNAWLAAARRAQYTIEHYPQTPSSRRALEILKLAYHELKLPELANDTQLVINANQQTDIQTAEVGDIDLQAPNLY